MNNYVLENESEFERLEKQSQDEAYNYKLELLNFHPKADGNILDAGCGSGIVSRYLASSYPEGKITGCDFSESRIEQAAKKGSSLSNLQFQKEDLTQLSFVHNSFDGIICRYVLEHLNENERSRAISELFRCLKPDGTLCAVDVDGFIFNLFPQTELVEAVLTNLKNKKPVDLNIGRKLPYLLGESGFTHVSWSVQTHSFQGKRLEAETNQMELRFAQLRPFFRDFIGDPVKTDQFIADYFKCLRDPNAVLFYNMFSVIGTKPTLKEIRKLDT